MSNNDVYQENNAEKPIKKKYQTLAIILSILFFVLVTVGAFFVAFFIVKLITPIKGDASVVIWPLIIAVATGLLILPVLAFAIVNIVQSYQHEKMSNGLLAGLIVVLVAAVVAGIGGNVIYTLVSSNNLYNTYHFRVGKWAEADEDTRGIMFYDLYLNENLYSKNDKEILELLGEPDFEYGDADDYSYHYYLGDLETVFFEGPEEVGFRFDEDGDIFILYYDYETYEIETLADFIEKIIFYWV